MWMLPLEQAADRTVVSLLWVLLLTSAPVVVVEVVVVEIAKKRCKNEKMQ